MKKLNEDQWAPNIACTDENLNINGIYQQLKLPSLGRSIFEVIDVHGPTAALFNITGNNKGGISVLRSEVEVFDSKPVRTGITQETIQDMKSQFGENAENRIATLLKGFANDDENKKTIAFLKANAVPTSNVSITDPLSPDYTWREISWKVQQCVLEMNSKHMRTYGAFVVLPYKYASAIMAVFADLRNSDYANVSNLFIGRSGLTDWFVNPDADDETVYVGLRDVNETGRGCAVFSPYQNMITDAIDPETGSKAYFIWNRYALTISPLHSTSEPMLMSFGV